MLADEKAAASEKSLAEEKTSLGEAKTAAREAETEAAKKWIWHPLSNRARGGSLSSATTHQEEYCCVGGHSGGGIGSQKLADEKAAALEKPLAEEKTSLSEAKMVVLDTETETAEKLDLATLWTTELE